MIKNLTVIKHNCNNILKICPIKKIQKFNTELTIIVQSKELLDILLFFKNHLLFQFKLLTSITAIDYPNKKFRFLVVYELLSVKFNMRLKIKSFFYELASVPSSTTIFIGAEWFETEIWDLFGIFFKNHPNLKRLLNDYGFEGFPLRKDFPLTGFIEIRYNELQKRIISEPVELSQEFRTFNYSSPWNI